MAFRFIQSRNYLEIHIGDNEVSDSIQDIACFIKHSTSTSWTFFDYAHRSATNADSGLFGPFFLFTFFHWYPLTSAGNYNVAHG